MAYYGNILIVFKADATLLQGIEEVLRRNKADYELVDTTFFLESSSMVVTGKIVKDIQKLGVRFIFFHNHNADGSFVQSSGMDEAVITHINRILFN